MTNIFEEGMAWHTFLGLEKDFIDITRYVALAPENSATWSERIAQLLLLTGSTVDSIFNEMRRSALLPQTNAIADLVRKSEPTITDYREVYDAIFQLSGVELEARYGLTAYGTIKPFEEFSQQVSPSWWVSYNAVKHDFFQNVRKGTLQNLVRALGGLFVLNILHKDSRQYLFNRGMIPMGDFRRRVVYWRSGEHYLQFIMNSFVGLPSNLAWDAWASSEIFLHQFRRDPNTRA